MMMMLMMKEEEEEAVPDPRTEGGGIAPELILKTRSSISRRRSRRTT